MQQDNLSYWTDIKTFEERLSRSPDSFCFARLSEVYLKVGLVYDALRVAREGVAKHPRYLSGLRALAMACHAEGLHDECRATLKSFTEALPEDYQAQKLFGQLLADAGDRAAARQAFLTVLEFVPDDLECLAELESLDFPDGSIGSLQPLDDDVEEEIIEDLEIIEEKEKELEPLPLSLSLPEPLGDPLSTATLAELYVKQGFIRQAVEIYRSILADNPGNIAASTRIAEIESQNASPVVKPQGRADNALDILGEWLDNIARLKACR